MHQLNLELSTTTRPHAAAHHVGKPHCAMDHWVRQGRVRTNQCRKNTNKFVIIGSVARDVGQRNGGSVVRDRWHGQVA